MVLKARASRLLLLFLAAAAPAQDEFAQGVADDLAGHAQSAFAHYLRAAHAGNAEAQLNVAVMADSGRGTPPDAAEAALYYALSASNGVARAAYDLGQLYETGDGVPQNPAMARAWFRHAASLNLPAAVEKLHTPALLTAKPAATAEAPPLPPSPLYPAADQQLPATNRVSFVWSAPSQPAATQYQLEILSLAGTNATTLVADISAAAIKFPSGTYAWRVIAFSPGSARYTAAAWRRFSVQ